MGDAALARPEVARAVEEAKQQPLAVVQVQGVPEDVAASVREAAEDASVGAFRMGLGIATALVALGGVLGLVAITNPRRRVAAAECPGGQLVGQPREGARQSPCDWDAQPVACASAGGSRSPRLRGSRSVHGRFRTGGPEAPLDCAFRPRRHRARVPPWPSTGAPSSASAPPARSSSALPAALSAAAALPKRAARALRCAVRGQVLLPAHAGLQLGAARLQHALRRHPAAGRGAGARHARRAGRRQLGQSLRRARGRPLGRPQLRRLLDDRRAASWSTSAACAASASPNGRATVGAGAQLIDVYSKLAARGLLVPAGSCPSVGIAGLALGGGHGLSGRRFGLTTDNLAAATIVTADGRARRVDADTNEDLYWACRGGGGGNFGIVTSLTFRAHRATGAAWFFIRFPWSQASEALAAWQRFAPARPARAHLDLHARHHRRRRAPRASPRSASTSARSRRCAA